MLHKFLVDEKRGDTDSITEKDIKFMESKIILTPMKYTIE